MIFIGLFLFIVAIVVGLNMHNSSNLEKIEEYLNTNNCKEYIYSNGSYKAFCGDKLLEINNSFTVDIAKNSKAFKYTDIMSVDIKKEDIIINDKDILKFKQKEQMENFYNKLIERIK